MHYLQNIQQYITSYNFSNSSYKSILNCFSAQLMQLTKSRRMRQNKEPPSTSCYLKPKHQRIRTAEEKIDCIFKQRHHSHCFPNNLLYDFRHSLIFVNHLCDGHFQHFLLIRFNKNYHETEGMQRNKRLNFNKIVLKLQYLWCDSCVKFKFISYGGQKWW